eukprot:2457978-Rhodomonas_salina.3
MQGATACAQTVLKKRFIVFDFAAVAMPRTEIARGIPGFVRAYTDDKNQTFLVSYAIWLRARCAMPGTDTLYAMRCPVLTLRMTLSTRSYQTTRGIASTSRSVTCKATRCTGTVVSYVCCLSEGGHDVQY